MGCPTPPRGSALMLTGALVALIIGFGCPLGVSSALASGSGLICAWEEDFETGGTCWCTQCFTRNDEIRVTDDAIPGVQAKCENSYLMAKSLAATPGAGYRADSPSFAEMGVSTEQTYAIHFRYLLPGDGACWTYALASKHVSLVVLECNRETGIGMLGFVEEATQVSTPLKWIRMNEWHDIRVRVDPQGQGAQVTVRIDNDFVARFERQVPSGYQGITFRDLPFRVVDATQPPSGPTCFGSGMWDDVRVLKMTSGDDPPRDIEIRVEPNPLNPLSTIQFDLSRAATVTVDVFDVAGRRVATLVDGVLAAGPQAIPWNGDDDRGAPVSSGTYFIRARVDQEVTMARATIVR